ncbi:MAG: 1-acyl-sn-glycerol-3-phosphate acyltransferase [Clostridia bacterium]|nr:1-acyl-sn-glycerol-3-phosphate acyltransferase [Clostridia bacterium]
MIGLYIVLGIIGGAVGIVVLHALFLCVAALFAKNKDYDKASGFYRAVFKYFMRVAIIFSRIKIKVTGTEKLNEIGGRFLLVGNHRSNYDPFVTALGLKVKELAFISKPENFKIPFFGKVARKCMYTAIDRDNAKNAIKTINRTAELIKSGVISFGVYPEGTRSKDKDLLPFHDGVFKIAQKAGVPIVVAVIKGTEKVHKNAPWKRTVVDLDIIDVLSAEEIKDISSHEIGDKVKAEMKAALGV